MTPDPIREIEELLEKAKRGPWYFTSLGEEGDALLRNSIEGILAERRDLIRQVEALKIERNALAQLRDEFYSAFEGAKKTAEVIVRPHITSAAIWGVIPDHKWKENSRPIDVEGDIAHALASAELKVEAARNEGIEAAAKVIESGSFFHSESPIAKEARSLASAIRSLKSES